MIIGKNAIVFAFFYSVIALILAFLFGSFASVLGYRLPRDLSIVKPGSFCPHCNRFLEFWQNIPVISYIFLQGRCFYCDTEIPIRYFLLELLAAVLASPFIYKLIFIPFRAFSEVGMDISHLGINFINYLLILILLSLAIAMAFIDFDTKQIPHQLSYPAIIFACIYAKFFLCETIIDILIRLGLCFLIFDAFNHFANKIIFKRLALPICPGALTFRFAFLERVMSYVYIVWICALIFLFINNQFMVLRILLSYLGISYIFNEFIIDFLVFNHFKKKITMEKLEEKYQYHPSAEFFEEQKVDFKQLKNAWGGGDTSLIVVNACFAGFQNCFLSITISFFMALLIHFFQKEKSREIRLGPALTFALFVAMILTV